MKKDKMEEPANNLTPYLRTEERAQRASILLVDDREENLVVLETILKDLDCSLVTARSGQEALRILFDQDFAVILLDVRMPDMDGFEAAELIRQRQRSRHTPIILITAADVSTDQIIRGYSAGAVDLIFKPFVHQLLAAKVRIFLELFRKTEKLRVSEERFRLLVERVKDYAIFMLDAEGRVISWNEGAEHLKGYRAEEIMGQNMSCFYTVEDVERAHPADLLRVAQTQGSVEDEGWQVRKDGTRFWADVVITALRDDQQRLRGFGKVTRDLTERKRAQKALGELSAQILEAQDRERRRISSALHDNTSPSFASLVSKLYQAKKRAESHDAPTSGIISDGIALAESLSREIRTFSYLLHPPLLDEKGLLASLRWYLDDFANRTGVRVKMDLPVELERLSRGAEISLFRIVQECFTNLLRESGNSQVKVRLAVNEKSLTLELSDEGRGLPPNILEQIAKGTGELGVGIAGMRERMKKLGGHLQVTSGSSGTLVTVSLPVGEVSKPSSKRAEA
jgi:PAS domain S-box-containing protein